MANLTDKWENFESKSANEKLENKKRPDLGESSRFLFLKYHSVFFIIQYANLPSDYDETYIRLTRQGARVLAMGIKQLEATRISDVRRSNSSSYS